MSDTTLPSDNPLRFRKNLLKTTVSQKLRTIDIKIEQIKVQSILNRETVKISAIQLGNDAKYEFLTGKYILLQKYFLETAATIKRFGYSLLGSELKKQTDIAEKEYQIPDKFFSLLFWSIKDNKNVIKSLIKNEDIAKPLTKKNYIKQNLNYNTASFFGCSDDKTKYSYLLSFCADLGKFNMIKPRNLKNKKEKRMILSVIYTMINLTNIMMNMKNYLMPNTSLETSCLKIIKINNFFDKKIQKLIKNKNQNIKH